MPNNKRDNRKIWIERLEAFEDNASSFNNEKAWEKLEERRALEGNAGKKKTYWIAAASILLLCLIGFLWKKNVTTVAEPPAYLVIQQDTISKNSIERIPVITATDPVKPVTAVNQDGRGVSKTKIEPPAILPVENKEETLLQQTDIVSESTLGAPVVMAESSAETNTYLPVTIKKLKIVHINELNGSAQSTGLAQQGRPYFPVTYQSRQVYTNTTEQSIKNEKNNLVRIKLFP